MHTLSGLNVRLSAKGDPAPAHRHIRAHMQSPHAVQVLILGHLYLQIFKSAADRKKCYPFDCFHFGNNLLKKICLVT